MKSGQIPPDKLKELQKILDIAEDFYRYCQNNLKIRTKSGELVPLEPNRIQKKIVNLVIDDLKNDRPIRYIVLKARQEGVSTIIEALVYWWTATNRNVKSKIVAHDQETASALYEMFRRYYENTNIIFKVPTKYNTKTDLTFDTDAGDGLKSQIDVSSAKNTGIGRGQTIQWLHGSEISLWPNGSELVAGLMQAVPYLPKTAIFLESTANGMNDYFHKTWQMAMQGKSTFKPLFFGWNEHDEYKIEPTEPLILSKEEEELQKVYDLNPAQLNWRREKMKDFADDPDKFTQEYPINDIEAFLASGRSRFHIPSLIEMRKSIEPGKKIELLEENEQFKLVELHNSPLTIWKEPNPARKYVIGADVSEGIGGDYSVATIMDTETSETVARWRGDAEPSEFGEILEQLGRFYNKALIACEINNHGLTTVQRLRDLNYGNLYRREKGLEERFETFTSMLGWKTDRRTKPLMINALAEAIVLNKIHDHDENFIRECESYVIDDRGRTNAQEGEHDDTVISTAIAMQVFEWTDVRIKRKNVHSRLPEKYTAIRKKFAGMKKKTRLAV